MLRIETRRFNVQDLQIGVVGGGAAGFFAAIVCATSHPHARVTLLEASHQPLSKVRISGGGRCNVTHACFEPAALIHHYPRGGSALRGAFTRFQPHDTVAWFAQHGVVLKTEADGRMFPVTDDSKTVVNCLLNAAAAAGVWVKTAATVSTVNRRAAGFELQLRSGETVVVDRLLLATGSNSQGYRLAQMLGHTIEPAVPSLFTFNIADPDLHSLAGVSVPLAQVKLLVPDEKPLEQTGPLLITHWGMSGPAILKLSAWGARLLHTSRYHATLQINWLPQHHPDQIRHILLRAKADQGKRSVVTQSPVELSRRLWQYVSHRAGIGAGDRWADLSKKALNHLLQELTQGRYVVQGKGAFKDEFVTCGGVRLKEVDFRTMQSRCCDHLYLAGEILDIDGVTGGFNFQSAWTTGWIAGQAMGAPCMQPTGV
jgi:predicted Rossmann fold flavoprotein